MDAPRLAEEFDREARATRVMLERLPADRFTWAPHPKSFTVGALASHLVDCVGWAGPILTAPEFNVDPATFRPFHADTPSALLAGFDAAVAAGRDGFAAATAATLEAPWRLLVRGTMRFERPRVVVLRDFTLSHLAHHRGQLSVYLRLLDVPVPGVYGPSADDRP
jgi:uncharacterized damage-inducible protein DinB